MPAGSHRFRTETRRLLDIVVNSLYSHPDVFLRELVSNASDALDRLRFEALTDHGLAAAGSEPEILVRPDAVSGTLTVSDNGIGMTADELSRNLGTIAGSGTGRFLAGADPESAPELIGRFGVGFYSAFMVAGRVEVVSRRAGSEEPAARWESDGRESFTVEEAERTGSGTDVILHLKEGMEEYLDPDRLGGIVRAYSDYLPHPVRLAMPDGPGGRALNSGTPLWLTPEKDVREGGYEDFYSHLSGSPDKPFSHLSCHVEGAVEFHALLFIPSKRPFEALMPDWHPGMDLYSRRIRILQACPDLLPNWLRFVGGVVESPDLPLNISREMLQQSQVLRTIGRALTRKVLDWLARLSGGDGDGYASFFAEFGDFLKEGLLSDAENRDEIATLLMAWTASDPDRPVLLKDLPAEGPGGGSLYYVTGPDRKSLAASPHLEAARRAGAEVLLLDGPLDGLVAPVLSSALGRRLIALDREEADADLSDEEKRKRDEASARLSGLLEFMKDSLGGIVGDVRVSTRLDRSPCVVVPGRDDPGDAFRGMMKAMRREIDEVPGILEINPDHGLTRYMMELFETSRSDGRLARCVRLVHQTGLILAGSPPADPASFAEDVSAAVLEGR